MEKVNIKDNKNLFEVIKQIKNTTDSEVLVLFGKKVDLYKNSSNLKVIKSLAKDIQKEIKFDVEDTKHKDYIDAVNSDVLEFDDSQIDLDDETLVKSSKKSGFSLGILRKKKSSPSKKNGVFSMKSLFMGFATTFLVVGMLFGFWWYIPTATVELTVDSEVLVKLLDVKAVADQESVDIENSTIPAFLLDVTETDFQTNPTTGEREIGEFAEGKVTLYNKTNNEIKIEKGMIIKLISTEDESLKYEITEDATVDASAEDVTTLETVYGTEEVRVKARVIGDKYNIKEEQKFEINDFNTDELVGENDARIDGGSSEVVSVVLQSDLDSLRSSLDEFIRKKAFGSLAKKTVKGQKFLESSIRVVVDSASFDKEVGNEATDVTLTMTVSATGLAYSEDDLDAIIAELIKVVVPESYKLDEESPEYEVAVSSVSADLKELSLQVKLRSHISPKLEEEKIINDLTGMKIAQAEDYLGSLSNVRGYEIVMSPKLPPIIQTMPQRSENITIEVAK